MTGKDIRLNKFFDGSNAVVVAVDHGVFDGPLPGMINLPETIGRINRNVSAVLVSPGMIHNYGDFFSYKGSPMAITRLNWSTVYISHWGYNEASTVVATSAASAIAAGSNMALISLTLKTGSEARDAENVAVFCQLREQCHSLGLPVIGAFIPPLAFKLSDEEMHEHAYRSCRILAELGADAVVTFHTPGFKDVVASCPVPVLCLGAEKLPTQLQALEFARKIIDDGGRGVVFGRNAIQVKDPINFQGALCEVVREGITGAQAVSKYGLID